MSGGALKGEEVPGLPKALSEGLHFVQLETNPREPYSVNLSVTVIDGALFIDAAEKRRWHDNMRKDPRVRLKVDGLIYRMLANPVKNPELESRFLPGRIIYRLDAASWHL